MPVIFVALSLLAAMAFVTAAPAQPQCVESLAGARYCETQQLDPPCFEMRGKDYCLVRPGKPAPSPELLYLRVTRQRAQDVSNGR